MDNHSKIIKDQKMKESVCGSNHSGGQVDLAEYPAINPPPHDRQHGFPKFQILKSAFKCPQYYETQVDYGSDLKGGGSLALKCALHWEHKVRTSK